MPDETIGFTDRVQGRFEQHLALSVGDFVLRRADGPFAYQLAVVVDDADQGITDVVRGVDLLASTPRQIYLQRLLRLPQPRYLHLPLVVTNDGEKLSKQTGAPPLRLDNPGHQLWEALDFLGQSPPADLKGARPEALWQWGIAAWNVGEDSNAAPVSNIEASRSKHVLAPLDAVAARFQKCLSNLSRDSIERTFTAAIARRNSPNARADDTEEQRPNR